uniref:IncF plasmid conjugative transfer pilus assembly protein TraC n=1 Tax=Pseudomonas fluorescens (strain SBW25) TaxID=216595 RepID=A0A0G4E4K0_PSEFS|nr:FtsK/SpoIIIE domain-containing protein [Pseudomonas fluorescens]CEK42165.1 IncF plasmid conjugative transfer pilus assembly protein TraC [Pseudomonas fluorescens SBW25]
MSATTQRDHLHLFDNDLQALARRNYQGGMPIQLLSDAYLFEDHGNYFHTVDGRFAKIWRIQGAAGSMLNNEELHEVCAAFGEALNKYPNGSSGQFMRHTHRDIRGVMGHYASNLDQDLGEFESALADSILNRQYAAAVSPNGFFAKLTTAELEIMRQDALSALDDQEADDVRENVTTAIQREINEGRYPYMSTFYLVFMWEPQYMFGKFIDKTWKAAMASVGLADADKLAFEAYSSHADQFGVLCNGIAQALAARNFRPEELNGQGFVNWQYQLMNPVRYYNMEPPKYRADIPIYDCLRDPELTPSDQALNTVANFAYVEATKKGWTIHDSDYEYFIRPVSVLGKPAKSGPGMMQRAMRSIESESLITLNWYVPSKAKVFARLAGRGRMIAAKKGLRIGDKLTLEKQEVELEAVTEKVSAENVVGREQFFDTSVHVCLMGFDSQRLDDQCQQLESLLWRVGYPEKLRGDAVVRTAFPLNYVEKSRGLLRRDTPHLTESLSHMCPIFIEYQGVPDPGIIMNNRAGQPIYLDLFGSLVVTGHSLIVGTTGSGKSFAFNNILMGTRVKYRPKVWIIDKGDSYESLCVVLGGNYIRLATEPFVEPITNRTIYPICINPFYLGKDEEGNNELPSNDDTMFITDMLVMAMTTGNGDSARTVHAKTKPLLYRALSDFFAEWVEQRPHDEPIMSDFIPKLIKTNFTDLQGEDLAELLTLFYGKGPYAAIFDGKLQVDWENDFTVLETQRMAKSNALGIVTLALFRQIDLYCKYKLPKPRKKLIAVDEAWATLSSPIAAAALAGFYREMRKYNAGCLLISQTVGDFVRILSAEAKSTGDNQDGILENTSHYFFLACSESDYKLAQDHLSFTEEEIYLWRSLASLPPLYSEVFYRMRTQQGLYYSGVFRLFASSVSLWIASSSPDDYAVRERKTQEIIHSDGVDEMRARQRAIVQLAKQYPYGARFHVQEAA